MMMTSSSISSVQSLSHVQLSDSMNRSMPGLPIHYQLSEFTQTRIHWVHDAIRPSHPLSSSSPPAHNVSQHQSLFKWKDWLLFASVGQVSAEVSASASILPMNIQDWFLLGWTGWISLQSKGLSRVFPSNTVEKHQFLVLSFLYSLTLTSIHNYW